MARRKTNVLFIWDASDDHRKYLAGKLEDYPEVELILPPDRHPETLMKFAPDADIMVGWKPAVELLNAATKLALFMGPGAGAQHLVKIFRELDGKKIVLCNNHGNAYPTAQHSVALLLALMNRIVAHHNWMAEGKWLVDDDTVRSTTLRDRTIGLLGYGAINRHVHMFLSGFDLEFAILKREWSGDEPSTPTPAARYDTAGLDEFMSAIDTLMIAVPITSLTRGIIGEKQLELLGPNGLLVNIARGPIVDEESLYTALKEKYIAGAAIDVWYDYHPEPDDKGRKYPSAFPFHDLDNVVLSPHRAASPFDDPKRWDDIIENIKRFADGRSDFLNVMSLEHEY